MAYPGRPVLRPLPQFAGTAGDGGSRADPELELTDRSHSAVCNLLDRRGVLRRGRGAPPARDDVESVS